jgi:hypothetical protein
MTGKQRAMVTERKKDLKATNAEIIKRAGYKTNDVHTASQIYLENMKRPEIASILNDYVSKAEQGVIEIAEYSKDMGKTFSKEGAAYASVALSAYKDVQDRVKGKPKQQMEITSTSVNLNLSLRG